MQQEKLALLKQCPLLFVDLPVLGELHVLDIRPVLDQLQLPSNLIAFILLCHMSYFKLDGVATVFSG